MKWEVSGILVLDKDSGWTSHDAVALVRSRFRIQKVGHAGTLDPMATGVLVLLLGQATKWSNDLSNHDKEYSGTLELGIKTDSYDITGKVTATCNSEHITPDQIREAFRKFEGALEQTPPMVSAVKHQGVRLYRLARAGKVVERTKRNVTVHQLKIEAIEPPKVKFVAQVSKGTYIRSLVHDLGECLGVGATLTELRRTKSGSYSIEEALTVEQLKKMTPDQLRPFIKNIESPVLN